MDALISRNPDFFKTVDRSGVRPRQLVYSTLDNLIISGSGAPDLLIGSDMDLELYADTVTLSGAISVPGGNVKIVARRLIVMGDQPGIDITPAAPALTGLTRTQPAAGSHGHAGAPDTTFTTFTDYTLQERAEVVDGVLKKQFDPTEVRVLSGAVNDGAAGVKGATGRKGDDAGRIDLMVGEVTAGTAPLTLIARGGAGREGQGGQDGTPGLPGLDGHANLGIGVRPSSSGAEPFLTFSNPDNSWPVAGGNGGNGGDGGPGGPGGNGGTIALAVGNPDTANVSCDVTGGAHGPDGVAGEGAAGGVCGKLIVHVGGFRVSYYRNVLLNVNGTPGAPGRNPDGTAAARAVAVGDAAQAASPIALPSQPFESPAGADGTITRQAVTGGALGQAGSAIFLNQLLQRARNRYLYEPPSSFGSKELREQSPAFHILSWLVAILSPMTFGPDAESLRKKNVLLQATALLNGFAKGRNVFGRTPTWVPRLSLNTFQADSTKLIKVFGDIEATYKTLMAAAEKAEDLDAHLAGSIDQLHASRDVLQAKRDHFLSEMNEIVRRIDYYSAALGNQRVALMNVISEEELRVKNYVGCSMDSVFKALEMVAFDPENAMMAVTQVASLMYGAMTTINGVKKEHILAETAQLQGDLKASLTTEFQNRIDPNHLSFKADKTALLFTDLDAFAREIEKFQDAFPDHGDALKKANADLKEIVKNRSDAVMEYNATAAMIVDLNAQIETVQAKAAEYQDERFKNGDPTRTGVLSYFAVLYQNLREKAMEAVSDAERAFMFWSASPTPPENGFQSFQQQALWTSGSAPSSFGAADLEVAFQNLYQSTESQQAAFGRSNMVFPSLDKPGNLMVRIDETTGPGVLFDLRTNRSATFETVMSQAGAGQFTIANTGDKYNIRAAYVRPRLIGAARKGSDGALVATGQAEMTIVHLGSDKLLAQDGTVATFSHDSVGTIFTYELGTPAGQKDFGSGGDGSFFQVGDDVFASLGVFTRWQITLPTEGVEANDGLDLSALSAIEIEFGVRAYPKTNFA